jgi:sodium/bile acid cotransporter 7
MQRSVVPERATKPLSVGLLACLLGLSLVPVAACQDPGTLSDTEKQARIDELYDGYRAKFPEAPEITVETLVERLAGPEPPVLVDVRSDEERKVSTIPGAISRQEFEEDPARFSGREVVTYCTIGYRSGLYTQKLVGEGWDASNLRGSILAWAHGGQELDRGGSTTRQVHVYGARWNLVPEGYAAVW